MNFVIQNRKSSNQTPSTRKSNERNREIHYILSVELILDSKTIALVWSETCRSVWKQSGRKKPEEDTGVNMFQLIWTFYPPTALLIHYCRLKWQHNSIGFSHCMKSQCENECSCIHKLVVLCLKLTFYKCIYEINQSRQHEHFRTL